MTISSQLDHIKRGIRLLFKPGWLVELRARTQETGWRGFYFTDHDRLSDVVLRLDGDPRVVALYYVINPCKPSLMRARAACGCAACKGDGLIVDNPTDQQIEQILGGPRQHLTSNDDIETLVWMFTDVDTKRAPGFEHEPSSDAEKAASKDVARGVLEYQVGEKKWPQPLLGDSGNGFHILWRVNLLNTQHNVHLIVDNLKALKAKFDSPAAEIDASVFNPARLTRAYGSTTRKGTSTEERPYRQNYLREPSDPVADVTLDNLLSGANLESVGSGGSGDMPELDPDFKPQDFFAHYEKQNAFHIEGEKDWQGNPILATDVCLFAGRKHSGDEYKSGFILGDTFGYKCFSDECEGKGIKEVFRILREAEDDQGNPLYVPYADPIYKSDTIEELLEAFGAEDLEIGEQYDEEVEKIALDKAMEAPKPALPEPSVLPEPVAILPDQPLPEQPTSGTLDTLPAWDKGSEALDGLGVIVNDLATHMLSVIFHHPEDVWQDGFLHFVKRIKTKLGFDRKWKKPEEGEAPQQTLKMPIGETVKLLIKFTEAHKRLPDKVTFKHWLNVSTDPDVAQNQYKDEVKKWVDKLEDKPASTFDITAIAFVERLDLRAEVDAVRTVFNHFLLKKGDIIGARTTLRKHFNASTTQDATFEQGTWQERTDAIYADFERNVLGVGDERKFKLGFPSIDKSGMNIGFDGDRAICLCGPASNRKTTAALSIAMNFAIAGKNGLFFAGEHQCMKVLKRLTLQLAHFFKDDPDIGAIPGLSRWEGLNRTATEDDLKKVKNLLLKLKAGDNVPGFIEPQNVNAVTMGEEDKVGALLQYAEATFPKYQWDFIIIDPLDTIMPAEVAGNNRGGANNWKLCSGIVDRLFDFSRNAFGGKGCMVIVTAQFGSDARRDVEKIQQKNAGMENFDDELESILKRDGLIQYFTTIGQRFDLALGVATRTKDGTEGLIVRGRDREGGIFNSCYFNVDPDTNYMTEKKKEYKVLDKEQAKDQVSVMEQTFDPALAEEGM